MTTVLGANFVNAVRVAFNRTSIHRGSPPFFDPVDLGVKNFYSYRDDETVMAVTGGFNISAATSTTGVFWTNSYQAADDLTLDRRAPPVGRGRQLRVLEVVPDIARAVRRQLDVQRARSRAAAWPT